MALQPFLFRVVSDDVVPVLLDGVVVAVYTTAEAYVTQGTTGTPTPGSGEVELLLDDGPTDYLVRLYQEGTSFPGAPFLITVDVPPPPNELEVTAHIGATIPVVTLSLKDELDSPIDNVIARVFDDADLLITELETGIINPGEADALLPGAPDPGQTYVVRWRPPSGKVVQGGLTQIIQVLDPLVPPATNVFDFVLETVPTPSSADSDMCLLFGYLADVSKQPIKNGTLVFIPRLCDPAAKVSGFPFPTQPAVVGQRMLVSEVRAKTNNDGYLEVALPRGSIFDAHLYGLETPGVQIFAQVYIPSYSSSRLEDVLLPYVQYIDTGAGSASLVVGESTDLDLLVEASNGQDVSALATSFVEFTSSDENVATVVVSDDRKIRITGIAPGTATITVDRVPDTWAPRVPGILALTVSPSPTILVTVS